MDATNETMLLKRSMTSSSVDRRSSGDSGLERDVTDEDIVAFIRRLRQRVGLDNNTQQRCPAERAVIRPRRRRSPSHRADCTSVSFPLRVTASECDVSGAMLRVRDEEAGGLSDTPHLRHFLHTRQSRRRVRPAHTVTDNSEPLLQQLHARHQLRKQQQAERQARFTQQRQQQQQQQLQQQQQQQHNIELSLREQVRALRVRRINAEHVRRARSQAASVLSKQHTQADAMYRRCLLRRTLTALKRHCQLARENDEKALLLCRRQRLRSCLLVWHGHTERRVHDTAVAASQLYARRMCQRVMYHWTQYMCQQRVKWQVATDLHALHVINHVFVTWRWHVVEQLVRRSRQLVAARDIMNRLVCRHVLSRWRQLPHVMASLRLVESRRNRLRRIVRDIIPDFVPPSSPH